MQGQSIFSLTLTELEKQLENMAVPRFVARQIFHWLYGEKRGTSGRSFGITSYDDMTNVSKKVRVYLAEHFSLELPALRKEQVSSDGTRKFLFGLSDDNAIETVFMKYAYGNSLCISSQVGCRMGCLFCASTKNGLVRNLTAGEMVGQVLAAERKAMEPVNHIVVMGIGEPFDNYEELSRFLTILHDKEGRNMSLRNITVSTCGLVPVMERFGEEWPQVNLAVSLHAPNDALRKTMMPVANRYSVEELLSAAKMHGEKTGRRVTYEYALVAGVNDTKEVIGELAEKLRGSLCHVNLIPLNEIEGGSYKGSARKRAEEVAEYLSGRGVPATVRRSLGRDIQAACGQLRNDAG